MTKKYIAIISITVVVAVCLWNRETAMAKDTRRISITKQPYGRTPQGKNVDLYTLTNANGLQATVITYGAIVTTLRTPDRDGNFADIVLGYETLDG